MSIQDVFSKGILADVNVSAWSAEKQLTAEDLSKCEHKSCWNCEFIRVGNFPYRTCAVYPDKYICAGDPDTEYIEIGYSTADSCSSFKFDGKTGRTTYKDKIVVEIEIERIKGL